MSLRYVCIFSDAFMSSCIRVILISTPLLYATARSYAEEAVAEKKEKAKQGFKILSEDNQVENWKHEGNWKFDSGVISREGKGGSLVYVACPLPDDFELRFDLKVAEGSNSGIYYRPTQYEYQILDNSKHRDGANPRTSAASLYFCVSPSKDMTKPVGQWNSGRIICKGTIIQHWLNGQKVIHMDYRNPRWAFNVNLLKQRGGDLEARGANLSLQDHGDPVWYRNIRLRTLTDADRIDNTPVEPETISAETLEAERKKLEGIIQRREAARERQEKSKR